ncbi:MAG: lactate racemase domain-containing protein, partial [Verrucomicrobiota bacterium]|nr:lactate racemase domain-containing protein [Verrucomicrobiota bacterium]
MRIDLAYGEGRLPIECPDGQVTVIEPLHTPELPDEKAAILEALMFPDKSPPLREMVKPDMRICILFTDITRATPNHRIIPWLLEYLADL